MPRGIFTEAGGFGLPYFGMGRGSEGQEERRQSKQEGVGRPEWDRWEGTASALLTGGHNT